MSLLSELNNQLIRLPAMRNIPLPRNLQLSVPQKVTVVSVTVGLALLGFLARYFRRKRHAVGCPPEGENPSEFGRGTSRRRDRDSRKGSVNKGRSPNGEAVRRILHRQASSSVSAVSVASSTAASGVSSAIASGVPLDVATTLTPQQLGVMAKRQRCPRQNAAAGEGEADDAIAGEVERRFWGRRGRRGIDEEGSGI
ncbi:mitoguardin-like [Hetaerina americana]|uniref:mitoguardin-like n=1 Tax=Hetaerina americana TaxID=62018 RepID=UPI003A7F1EAA